MNLKEEFEAFWKELKYDKHIIITAGYAYLKNKVWTWFESKLSQQREEIEKENEKLLALLQMRDGGGHDADCKANYGRQCNCGHETAKQYLRRNK